MSDQTQHEPTPIPLLKNRQFVSLLAGNTTLFFGFSATILVRSLIVWELTGDEMALALINLLVAGGIFVTSFFSGVIVDRVERKRLLLLAHGIIFASELAALLLYANGLLTFKLMLLFTLSLSITFPFVMPTRTTMLVPAVGKFRLAKATAMMSSGTSVARMLSPAIAGFLADAYNLTYAYIFMVFLYAASLLFVVLLEPNYPEKTVRKSFFSDIKMGFSYIYNHKPLAACLAFGMVPMLVVVPLQNLLVIFAENVWDSGGGGLGILMVSMGIGGLVGSVIAARIKTGTIAKSLMVVMLLLTVFLVMFSHAPTLKIGAVLIMLLYICSVTTQILVHTSIQLMTEDSIRGRVTTISLMSYGLAPLGTLPLAYASKTIGAPWAITGGAVFVLGIAIYMWLRVPSFREIDAITAKYQRPIVSKGRTDEAL